MVEAEGGRFHPVDAHRNPNVSSDVKAAFRVQRILREVRPETAIAGTPKMGLLLLTAARLGRTPNRVYLCHGLRFEGYTGWKRRLLTELERSLARLSTHTIAVSQSVRQGLIDVGVPPDHVEVLGFGSANGIDTDKFRPASPHEVETARERFDIAKDDYCAVFVGRLTRDKGISALLRTAVELPDLQLMIAGTPEPHDSYDREVLDSLNAQSNVRLLGRVDMVDTLLHAADLLLLPTLREGLPTVILEASASGLPTVARVATGTVDVVSNETGILVSGSDDLSFAQSVKNLLADAPRLREFGMRARDEVVQKYDQHLVWANWQGFFERLQSEVRP